MLLDWMEGKTFEEAFKGAPEDDADARLRLLAWLELAKAIEVIHRKNILHRDLKPENVLLRNERRPKDGVMVIDFGLAVQDRSSEEGSAGYQAPEQHVSREENLRASADVFSIGQIGWRLFRGSTYSRYGDDDEIPKLPYGTEEVARIFFQATDRDPKKRPSVSSLKNMIRRLVKE
jgi:serine/threonine protein kinase